MFSFPVRGLIVAAIASLLFPAGAFAQTTPTAGGGEQYTPILQSVSSPPQWFTGSDGRVHLVYELILTNAFPVPVTVSTADVLDSSTGKTIESLTGDALSGSMTLLTSPTAPVTTLPPSTVGVVWFDIDFDAKSDLPASVSHQLTATVPPGLPVPETIVSVGATADVDLRDPIVLGPPLLGPRWAAVGSCCDGPHRRSMQAIDGGLYLSQRFAIDFNLLDEENRLGSGDSSLNPTYAGFGQSVIAVANAVVVEAVDHYPDQTPNAPLVGITLESADGNHVILDLGEGRYGFYAHLESGSVAVKTGDRVKRGQIIGKLGNSGSSTGPHLHFHVMDGPFALKADGMPYVFEDFDLSGRTPPISEIEQLAVTLQPIPVDPAQAGPRHDALPLGGDVVDFPPAS